MISDPRTQVGTSWIWCLILSEKGTRQAWPKKEYRLLHHSMRQFDGANPVRVRYINYQLYYGWRFAGDDGLVEKMTFTPPHKIDENLWKNREQLEEILNLLEKDHWPAAVSRATTSLHVASPLRFFHNPHTLQLHDEYRDCVFVLKINHICFVRCVLCLLRCVTKFYSPSLLSILHHCWSSLSFRYLSLIIGKRNINSLAAWE